MKITNEQGLPRPFVSMVESDYVYKPKQYSVTSLLKPVREMIMERRHTNEIEQDVSDMIWLLFGKAVHAILEHSQEEQHQFTEVHLKEEVLNSSVSGYFDLYDAKTKTIDDYKVTSVWKVVYGDYVEWRRQLMLYAYLLREAGFEVERVRIIAILKDHSLNDAKKGGDYPKRPVFIISFAVTDENIAEMKAWLFQRVKEIEAAELLPDNELPVCSPEDRWNKGDKYAVYKKGNKTTYKVCESQEQAEQWMADNKKGDTVVIRPGVNVKCVNYCRVAHLCNWWQAEQANNTEEGDVTNE